MISTRSMKLVLHKEEIKKSLAELKEHVNTLRILLEPCSAATYAPAQRMSAHDHQRSKSGEQRQRKRIFDDFYDVLCSSFHCNCGAAHEANLCLSDSLELVFPIELAERAMSGQIPPGAISEFQMRARSLTMDSQATAFPIEADETDNAR
jgi:hypothetical protein